MAQQASAVQPTQQLCDHAVAVDCEQLIRVSDNWSFWGGGYEMFVFCPFCGSSLEAWWRFTVWAGREWLVLTTNLKGRPM